MLAADIRSAQESVALYSGFITLRRVKQLADIFSEAAGRGIKLKAVVPPPIAGLNGSMSVQQTRAAISKLKELGFVVDMRASIHEKAVLIDDEVLLHGSLNPLSYAGQTSESMLRIPRPGVCTAFAKKTAVRGERSIKNSSDLVNRITNMRRGTWGDTVITRKEERFECVQCRSSSQLGALQSKGRVPGKTTRMGHAGESPVTCEKCGGKMIKHQRDNKTGAFWG